jgi:hypothetical protein
VNAGPRRYVPARGGIGRAAILAVFLGALLAPPASGGLFSKFDDPEDGRLDLSDYLQSRSGFLLVPIIITEPAVGFGGGLAPIFIKRPEGIPEGGRPTPKIYGGAVAGTQNGTWGSLGLYLLPFSGDRYRLTGALGYLSLNLKFYGFGAESVLQEHPVSFTIETGATFQRFQTRIGSSNFYAGLQYIYLRTRSRFDGELPAGIAPRELESDVGGLGGIVEYDTRNNFLSPNRGNYVLGEATAFEPAFGGDASFGKARIQGLFFGRPFGQWGYGFRVDAKYAWGDMPFYMRPALDMRGLTGGKYLDKIALLAEGEPRFWIDERWMLLAFGGVGRVAPDWNAIGSSESIWAAGLGFRYLLAKKLGLQAGVDFGFGPSGQRAVYIQVGSAWK